MIMKRAVLAAAAAGAALAAQPAAAATFTLVCEVRSTENNEITIGGKTQRPNGYTVATETLRIDDTARTVTQLSRVGTYFKPDGGREAINESMQFYGDVRSITPEQIVYCTDGDYKCTTGVTEGDRSTTTANVSLVIIDLGTGAYSRSLEITGRSRDGNVVRMANRWTGTCKRN